MSIGGGFGIYSVMFLCQTNLLLNGHNDEIVEKAEEIVFYDN